MTTLEYFTPGIAHLVEMEFRNSKGTLESKLFSPLRAAARGVQAQRRGAEWVSEIPMAFLLAVRRVQHSFIT